MTTAKRGKKDSLLAEVVGVGGGHGTPSALDVMQVDHGKDQGQKTLGRPSKEPTIPFTLRLRRESAELLQFLVADLRNRALHEGFPRSEATIGTVVEQGLALYAEKHGINPKG